MRKITKETVYAFENNEKFKKQNMVVNELGMYLHNHKIAEFVSRIRFEDGNKNINITLAGWNTNTTRERLNGLEGVRVTTKHGQAYLNGEKWNGDWITIIRN